MADKKWLPDPSTWSGTWRDDWRIMGQEGYLMDKVLRHIRFCRELCVEDYLQCEFCWAAFDEDPNHPSMAYFEPQKKVWVCEKCFADFQRFFRWKVEEPQINEEPVETDDKTEVLDFLYDEQGKPFALNYSTNGGKSNGGSCSASEER